MDVLFLYKNQTGIFLYFFESAFYMIYLENNQNIQDVWIPRQEVNQTAFTRYASEEYVDNAIANETARTENTYAKKTDLTAYTLTDDFATINGSAITQGGNIVIETGGNYSAGTNIQIEDDVISVTGITVPTKLSDLENDEGFITDDALSGYSTTEEMNTAISNATSGLQETLVSGTNIKTINGESVLGSGNIEIQGGEEYSAGTNIQIENNVISVTGITVPTKLSDLTNDEGFITTADTQDFVTSADVKTQIEDYGYITEDALSGYSTTQEMNTAINNATSGKVDTSAMTQYYTSGETDTAISNATSGLASQSWVENKGYLTGYTESDPVFMASPASGITAQDIENWNSVTGITVPTKLSELENDEGFITSADIPTSNTAFTNDAGYITEDALSGYAATSALTTIQNQINEVEEVTATALDDLNDRVDEISGNSVTTGTVESMITAATSGLASETYVDNAVSGKQDTSAMTAYYTSGETDTAISNATSGLQETLVSGTNIKTIKNESILGSGNITIQGGGGAAVVDYNPLQVEFQPAYSYIDYYELVNSGTTRQYKGTIAFDTINGNTIFHSSDNDKVNWTIPTSGDIQTQIDSSISGKVDTSAMTAYYTSAQTNTAITAATQHMVTSISDSVIHIESVTQAEYDAMESGGTLDMNTLYVIKSN